MTMVMATVGCWRAAQDPRRLPVSGVVTSEGKPLERGSVLFAATEGTDVATAPIREGGRFTTTLLPGEYRVAVRSYAAGDPDAEGISTSPPKSLIPVRYGDAKTSGLKVTAANGMPPVTLELGR